jgi:hypothetical protein
MKLIEFKKSDRPEKKYMATFETDSGRTKTTHFGDSSMKDYTQHHDKKRREAYRSRHAKDLDTGDYTRAGYLSFYVLWGPYTSVRKNLEYYKQKFNL